MIQRRLTEKHFKDLLSLKRALRNYIKKLSASSDNQDSFTIAKNHPIWDAVCDLEGNYPEGKLPSIPRDIWRTIYQTYVQRVDMLIYCQQLQNWVEREFEGKR